MTSRQSRGGRENVSPVRVSGAGPDIQRLARALMAWYADHRRDLPWRRPGVTPYEVLVAEVMLQQTQVTTVLRYYDRFLATFPDLSSLARASEADVLRLWQGLGYYRRARNLQRTARELCKRFGGQVPSELTVLRKLPGVGEYTARAILAFAFNRPVVPVDANVARVLARLWAVPDPIERTATRRRLSLAGDLLAAAAGNGQVGQALMDLGATICTPRYPQCAMCPLADNCVAARNGAQDRLPVTGERAPVERLLEWGAIVFDDSGRVLLLRRKRPLRWGGLWEFPRFPRRDGEDPQRLCARLDRWGLRVHFWQVGASFTYQVTRFRVSLRPWGGCCGGGRVTGSDEHDQARWVRPERLGNYALPSPQRRLARLAKRWARELTQVATARRH